MHKKIFLSAVLAMLFSAATALGQTLSSPDGNIRLDFGVTKEGEAVYKLTYKGKAVIKDSRLGFILKDSGELRSRFMIVDETRASFDQTWQPVWGEVRSIRNNYNEYAATLEQMDSQRRITVRFRLFNDGLGFRYEFPEQEKIKNFIIDDEVTEFNQTGDHTAFWIPGDYDSNEYSPNTTHLSAVSVSEAKNARQINFANPFAENAVQTPLTIKTADGLYLNIHEAGLVNFPAMYLIVNRATFRLTSHLARNSQGSAAFLNTPSNSPWRTIIVSDRAADLLSSRLILNLNEPTKIKDTTWIKPQKFVGVWWEMHVGKSSWEYSTARNVTIGKTDWKSLTPNGKHGANTANVRRYIDFAAKHGFDGVLVEGWNVGWEDWYGNWKENVFDFMTPYPDFDIDGLKKYAAMRGVKLIMHHETSASATNYERRLDDAFRFMKRYGYETVKTGYVGKIIPRGEAHDGQWMVNHYNFVAEKAADYKIMLDVHEPVRPTGLSRTYPNWMASEAARGNEFNAWSVGNLPEHETILPFTRLMGGPMDYTPGIFQIDLSVYGQGKKERVHTTLAKQLALYVTMYSPLQMAADLPENYEQNLEAFQFIKDVAVDWDDTRILEAEPGDYITIARKAKGKDEWYVGGITDENGRSTTIDLSFLTPGRSYLATIYRDAEDSHWDKNPMHYEIEEVTVTSDMRIPLALAPGGGFAISFKPR